MNFFNKYPIFRLFFAGIYLISAVVEVLENISLLGIVLGMVYLFGCYISVVKSGCLRDYNAKAVNNLSFDILSCIILIQLIIRLLIA